MITPSLLDAIRVVKENEKIALESYSEASRKINSQVGKHLFEELSKFEQYHYDILSALVKSLEATGTYINYEGREFPLPPVFEIKASEEPNKKSVITIIAQAIELEKTAEKAYADLALQIPDPVGHDMFTRLAGEEYKHHRILMEAYWTVSNLGTWKWIRP